jgi:hypothetical protein
MSESLNQNFNHLKVHTQYSICEGAAKIDDLQEYCKSNKIKSLGISDTSNLCGALEFAEKISKSGTQPIIGTQINFKLNDTTGLLPLFALNETGYKNIIKLSSNSYLENDELSDPHVNFDELLKSSDGVSVFSGTVLGLFGKLFDKGKFSEITELYQLLKKNYNGHLVDKVARKFLKKIGLNYSHGTGHGVGFFLNVHEGPQAITKNNKIFFKKGMILSNEPGYYLKNKYGIRIENLIYTDYTNNKLVFNNLTYVPIDIDMIDFKMLSPFEKKYMFDYHLEVYSKISKYLTNKERKWLINLIK